MLLKKVTPILYTTSEIFELPEIGELVYKDTFKSLWKCTRFIRIVVRYMEKL